MRGTVMSTITATPTPSFGRAPLVIGIAAVGIAAAAVVVPRLHTITTTADTQAAAPASEAPESLGRRDAAAAAAAAAAAGPAHLQDLQHLTSKGLLSSQTAREQVPGLAPTFPYNPALSAAAGSVANEQIGGAHLTYAYDGRELVPVLSSTGSVANEQIGGAHLTYAYDGRELVPVLSSTGSAGTSHTTWSDIYVPPYDDPAWSPYIRAHFYGPFPVPSARSGH